MFLSLVIPFYNEEEKLEDVIVGIINEFNKRKFNLTLIAVNNGSSDNTFSILQELSNRYSQIKIVNISKNKGYGFGVVQGMKEATGDFVGYTVGDGQVSGADVARIYDEVKRRDTDFCQGKRNKEDRSMRRISTWGLNFIFHLFFPCPVFDVGGSPKIMKKEVYLEIKPTSNGWFIDSEIIIKNYLRKSKMKEVLVSYHSRIKGVSKHILPFTVFVVLVCILKWRFKAWFMKTKM